MNTLDLIILGVIGVSSLLSLFRGFLGEFLSLVGWVFAICMPMYFTSEFAALLPAGIESPTARMGVSAVTLFVGSLVVTGIISFLFRKLIGASGLGFADRLLGSGFGFVRGIVILAVVALLATYSPTIPQERWWKKSSFLPHILKVSSFIHGRLPADIARRFSLGG